MKPTYSELVAAGRAMREAQKRYFALCQGHSADYAARNDALYESKRLERDFDKLLTAADSPQESLL